MQIRNRIVAGSLLLTLSICTQGEAQEVTHRQLVRSLEFHSSFDSVLDPNFSNGEGAIYTAETLAREKVQVGNHRKDVKIVKDAGKFGDAVYFGKKSKQVLFYRGNEIYIPEKEWAATFSFWLKLDPDRDLEPGYCDPLQMTEKAWNDASLFVDFDKDLPRDFRLGVFPDLAHWNPKKTPWDQIPVSERPMVTVKKPPFSKERWTHVAFAFNRVNSAGEQPGEASLYLNGEHQGTLRQSMKFTWDQDKVAIMLGINYIGYIDDMAIFGRALSAEEVAFLYELPRGIATLKR